MSVIAHTGFARVLLGLALVLGVAAVGAANSQANPNVVHPPIAEIVRNPTEVPPAIGERAPATLHVDLNAVEVTGGLDPANHTTYRYWTFNGKVPGPMIRARQGDTVVVTLHNDAHSHMVHSVDFHAALGPGGGAAYSQALPGQSKTFSFVATTPGLFVYHCGTPMIAEHIANGMYGLILVEPPQGLPHVDHEFYLMQGEIYTAAPMGKPGLQQFSTAKLMQEAPEYFVFNGAVGAVTGQHAMQAKVGETVRVFFGDAGPNKSASLHAVGEIFTREYPLGAWTTTPLTGVQTADVPPGGAAILELKAAMPGEFNFMDHAIARMAKGDLATLKVTGADTAHLMYPDSGSATDGEAMAAPSGTPSGPLMAGDSTMPMMPMNSVSEMPPAPVPQRSSEPLRKSVRKAAPNSAGRLDGCLLFDHDIASVRLFHSARLYQLDFKPGFLGEHPLGIAQNVHALVELTGHAELKTAVGERLDPLFVVDSVQQLAPTCDTDRSLAELRDALRPHPAQAADIPEGAVTIGMSDMMAFTPATITIHTGQTVVWKNTSVTIHNVVDDASKASDAADVHLPATVRPFDSGYMQPGQAYARTFTVPGMYRYVCTLHESSGMKGVVIVR